LPARGHKNVEAIARAKLPAGACRKRTNQGAYAHNKFVVLLKNDEPQGVWTGSTNWTPGAIYGQLNVGHSVYDPNLASQYERYFQLLYKDPAIKDLKGALATETNVATIAKALKAGPGIWAIFSPQPDLDALQLYADICAGAACVLACAPFELDAHIATVILQRPPPKNKLRYALLERSANLGTTEEVSVINRTPSIQVSVPVSLKSPLHDFQNRLLTDSERAHHSGLRLHAKLIVADPFGDEPIVISGSANYSSNSTVSNDENTLLLRGKQYLPIADIYLTEFFRIFDSYYSRGKLLKGPKEQQREVPTLAEDDNWTNSYYQPGSDGDTDRIFSRQLFAGTLRQP
jgi:phosphatidylserine/phosphatidylglycerophosphate/cardiolipin synthase-like enzyme